MESETFHLEAKHKRTFIGLGVTQIVIGVVCAILGVVVFLTAPAPLKQNYTRAGIWGGILCCICGAWTISIGRSCRQCNCCIRGGCCCCVGGGGGESCTSFRRCNIITGLVMAIIASLLGLVCGILDAIQSQSIENSRDILVALAVLHFIQMVFGITVSVLLACRIKDVREENVGSTKTTIPAAQQGQKQEYALPTVPDPQVHTKIVTQQEIAHLSEPKDEHIYEDLPAAQLPLRKGILRTAAGNVKQQGQVAEQNPYLMPNPDAQQGQEQDYVLPPVPKPPVNTSITAQKQGQDVEPDTYLMPLPDDQEHNYILPPPPVPEVETKSFAEKQMTAGNPPTPAQEPQNKMVDPLPLKVEDEPGYIDFAAAQ